MCEYAQMYLRFMPPKGCQDQQQLMTTMTGVVSGLLGAARGASAFSWYHATSKVILFHVWFQAIYFASGMIEEPLFMHSGLACPIYPPFTSPIRRYADVIVHRLLAVSISADQTYPELLDKKHSEKIANNINYRHRMAQYASRASVNLHTHIFFKNKKRDETGYILFVRQNAVQVRRIDLKICICFSTLALQDLVYIKSWINLSSKPWILRLHFNSSISILGPDSKIRSGGNIVFERWIQVAIRSWVPIWRIRSKPVLPRSDPDPVPKGQGSNDAGPIKCPAREADSPIGQAQNSRIFCRSFQRFGAEGWNFGGRIKNSSKKTSRRSFRKRRFSKEVQEKEEEIKFVLEQYSSNKIHFEPPFFLRNIFHGNSYDKFAIKLIYLNRMLGKSRIRKLQN